MLFILLLVFSLLFITGWVDNNPIVTFISGLLLGLTFILWIIRKLVKWAIKSPFAWALLVSFLTYKIARKITGQDDNKTEGKFIKDSGIKSHNRNDKAEYDADRKDIFMALRSQGFNRQEVESAVEFANNPNLEDKIQRALQYLGSKPKN